MYENRPSRIEGDIGKSGFGVPYLAQDEDSNRELDFKLPLEVEIHRTQDPNNYLFESEVV